MSPPLHPLEFATRPLPPYRPSDRSRPHQVIPSIREWLRRPAPVVTAASFPVSKPKRPVSNSIQSSKPRKSRRVYDFSAELLSQYFHLSQKDAAARLGVAVITIKRNCKQKGISWPYRANKTRLRREQAARQAAGIGRQSTPLTTAGVAYSRLPLLCLESKAEAAAGVARSTVVHATES